MALLSNFDIIDICNHLQLPLVGIFMKDQLPKNKNPPIGYYIINMESSTDGGSGSHWVCLCNIPDRRFYFDSFGNGPPQLVEKFIAKDQYYINSTRLQYENSEFCGWYCLAIMYFTYYYKPSKKSNIKTRIESFNKYYNSRLYKGNYKKLIKFFDSVFKKHSQPEIKGGLSIQMPKRKEFYKVVYHPVYEPVDS